MRWLHRDQVALLPTPICHLQRIKEKPSAQTHSHEADPEEKRAGIFFFFPEKHLVKNKVRGAHVFATSLTR